MSILRIEPADLDSPQHAAAIVELTAAYAQDPMGNNRPLPDKVLQQLVPGLRAHPTTIVFLAWHSDMPVGIATCFLGFSTFAARPLINIHDLAVRESHRGQGIAHQLLNHVEQYARDNRCCKMTLEVLENNHRAMSLYRRFGFEQAEYAPEAGGALAFSKSL